MGTSMYYTNLLILLVIFISGCASTPSDGSSDGAQATQPTTITASGEVIALYRQAITELNNNQLEKAEISFLEMIKLQPDLAGPWANLALLYIKQKQYDKAEQNIQAALKRNPGMAQALNLRGYIESTKGHINKAKELYEKAITSKPDYALAHYNLALLYDVYLQNIPKAIEHYQRYLTLIEDKDPKTKDWVEELKRNIKSGKA